MYVPNWTPNCPPISISEKPGVSVAADAGGRVDLSGTANVQNGTDAIPKLLYGEEDRRELRAVHSVCPRTVKRVMRVRFYDESG
jgi:hypothetical protein